MKNVDLSHLSIENLRIALRGHQQIGFSKNVVSPCFTIKMLDLRASKINGLK
jgi:hypothetical protein